MNVDFWSPIFLSLKVALLSGTFVLIVGTIIAKLMTKRLFFGKTMLGAIILLPLVLPPTVIGFILIVIFGRTSPVGNFIEILFHQPIIFTWYAAIIAASVVAFPLMYQSAKASFEQVESGIEEAARVDGANEKTVFFKISLPLAYRGIIAGAVLSFTRALGEFGATLMFAGNIPGKTRTIPTAIYIAMDSGNTGMAWLWAATSIGISVLLLFAINKYKT